MLCEKCNEQEATVHLTQVVDGNVKKLHLCETCASDAGFDLQGPVSITDILLGSEGGALEPERPVVGAEYACPECGLSRSTFKKHGRLGCPHCYEVFSDDIRPLLKAVHHSLNHAGKVPQREGSRVRLSAKLAELEKALKQAVANEAFEEAARLRDAIKTCRREAGEAHEEDPG